jgi:SMI1-KNR4 cell-wall
MKMKLENSFPVILSNNAPDEVWSFFDALPKDYKKFLDNTNGGFAEEFKYTFETGVPYITEKVNNPSKTDCVIEFFGICTSQTEREKFPKDLIETAKEYVAEEFLPLGIIAIASCIQNSLVCVSLRKNDFGQIFYWDWYWKYP